jgi:hypothetical protein
MGRDNEQQKNAAASGLDAQEPGKRFFQPID